jgi:hypothetical protein
MSWRRKGQLGPWTPVYSPGRRRKKKAIIVMSAMAAVATEPAGE